MSELTGPSLVRAPELIIGYHGCELSVAMRLLNGDPFRLSANDYDWLGSGAYFFEYAPHRARESASQQFGWAVLRAEIRLGDCLNLLDTQHLEDLQSVHGRFMANFLRLGCNHQGTAEGRIGSIG